MSSILKPLFILGNPRSGTTLLRLMLDSHSQITIPPECGFMIWFYEKFKNRDFTDTSVVIEFLGKLKNAKKIGSWSLDYNKLQHHLLARGPANYGNFAYEIYRFYAQSHDKDSTIIGDKNNFHIFNIDILSDLFPQAYYVHIVRDGRDVACSYLEINKKSIQSEFAPQLPTDIRTIAKQWDTNNELILSSLEKYAVPTNRISIKYEDLILDTENVLSRVTDILRISYEERMLGFYELSKSHEPKEYLQWKQNTRKPLQSSSIGRFKFELSSEQVDEFNYIAHNTLKRFEYAL